MYFSGNLSADPSSLSHVQAIKPTKIFGRILHHMTRGRSSEKEEQETFKAVSILQQFNMVFRSMGIRNIVRLSKDAVDFYLDEEGKKDDMKEALEHFDLELDDYESELFDRLYLVVEHQDTLLKYLIEVEIKRRHRVDEYPISVKVNGVIRELTRQPDETAEQLVDRMKVRLNSQEAYDQFVQSHHAHFDQFLEALNQNIRKFIQVDDLTKRVRNKIIRPKKPVRAPNQSNARYDRNHSEPAYHGYHGFNDVFFYAWLWSDFTHSNHIHVNQCDLVDESGDDVMSIGDEGFNAGESDAMNSEADFTPPEGGDVEVHENHGFQDDLKQSGFFDGGNSSADDSGGGWLDSFSSSGGDDGGSSCSSCGGGD